jgi:hypothetical protein
MQVLNYGGVVFFIFTKKGKKKIHVGSSCLELQIFGIEAQHHAVRLTGPYLGKVKLLK